MLTLIPHPSPNFDARPPGTLIDTVVIHYTDMISTAASLERLCDPFYKVSSHYLIDEGGGNLSIGNRT